MNFKAFFSARSDCKTTPELPQGSLWLLAVKPEFDSRFTRQTLLKSEDESIFK